MDEVRFWKAVLKLVGLAAIIAAAALPSPDLARGALAFVAFLSGYFLGMLVAIEYVEAHKAQP